MSKAEKPFALLTGAALMMAVYAVIIGSTGLPTVQIGDQDQCVRVLVVEGDKEVAKPCSAVNLKEDRYHVERVYGTDAETKRWAAEIADQLKQQAAH